MVAQVAQRGCGINLLGGIQKAVLSKGAWVPLFEWSLPKVPQPFCSSVISSLNHSLPGFQYTNYVTATS